MATLEELIAGIKPKDLARILTNPSSEADYSQQRSILEAFGDENEGMSGGRHLFSSVLDLFTGNESVPNQNVFEIIQREREARNMEQAAKAKREDRLSLITNPDIARMIALNPDVERAIGPSMQGLQDKEALLDQQFNQMQQQNDQTRLEVDRTSDPELRTQRVENLRLQAAKAKEEAEMQALAEAFSRLGGAQTNVDSIRAKQAKSAGLIGGQLDKLAAASSAGTPLYASQGNSIGSRVDGNTDMYHDDVLDNAKADVAALEALIRKYGG